MAEIRTNMSKEDIVHNMLEITCYLAEQDEGVNEVNVKVRNLNMHFEAWTEKADADRDNEPCCRCNSRQTNADIIRNMSDKELGDLLQSVSSGVENGSPFISLCVDDNETTINFSDISEWLKSEAE